MYRRVNLLPSTARTRRRRGVLGVGDEDGALRQWGGRVGGRSFSSSSLSGGPRRVDDPRMVLEYLLSCQRVRLLCGYVLRRCASKVNGQ